MFVETFSGPSGGGSLEKAVGDLFFSDGGFSFSQDAKAYEKFSQKLSQICGRPITVVNLADLPHAYEVAADIASNTPFSKAELVERTAKLEVICVATHPALEKDFWSLGFAENTAKFAVPNLGAIFGWEGKDTPPVSLLPARMEGAMWNRAAIMLVPDRRWCDKTMWAKRTGIAEDKIAKYPHGDGPKFMSFFHELSHVLQRGAFFVGQPDSAQWPYEGNADIGAVDFSLMVANDPRCPTSLSRSIRLSVALEAPVRALERFLISPDYYATSLVIDAHLKGEQPPTFERIRAVDEELRWRCYKTDLANGKAMSARSGSQIIQNTIDAWREGTLLDKSLATPISNSSSMGVATASRGIFLRSLQEVMSGHPVTDPDTIREGGLVLRAARFFAPSIFDPALQKLAQPTKVQVFARRKVARAPQPTAVTQIEETPFLPGMRNEPAYAELRA